MSQTSRFITCAMLGAALISCGEKGPSTSSESGTTRTPAAPEYISAHTSGAISRESTVRVRFASDVVPEALPELASSPITLSPQVGGKARWRSRRELEFRPHTALEPGRTYSVEVDLGDLALPPEADDELKFEFNVKLQAVEVRLDGLTTASDDNSKEQYYGGMLQTADVADAEDVEKTMVAEHAGKTLSFKWSHSENRRRHGFTITGIVREQDDTTMNLSWDAGKLGVTSPDAKQSREVTVPGLNKFSVTAVRAVAGDDQHVKIRFTDAVKRKQPMKGLIKIVGHPKLRFRVRSNTISVYSKQRFEGLVKVSVSAGIKSTAKFPLKNGHDASVSFDALKPQVKWGSKGVLIPTSGGLTIPIETVNLRALKVEAMQVFDDNVPQFLQVNNLDGRNELKRVGRVIWKKTISLGEDAKENGGRWVRHGLDLGPLVENHPGGLYRLRLTFDRRHIIYACADSAGDASTEDNEGDLGNWDEEQEDSYWDSYGGGNNSYYEMRTHRRDPCHAGYYHAFDDHNVERHRNVLITDIGLMAKVGGDGSVFVAASDLKTAEPLTGAKIELLDYQQQAMVTGETDSNGTARFETDRPAFVVHAEHNGQHNYVRLDPGTSLALGHFDVSGAAVSKGLKGKIYGERGVWRPGDTIFLTFTLHDPRQSLPENHPVRFELYNPRGQVVQTINKTKNVGGFFNFTTKTNADDPTGNYLARVTVGGARFEETITVETVRPNRLKIEMDFGTEMIQHDDKRLTATLKSTWLHGAIAGYLDSDVEVTLKPKATHFRRFAEFVFDDPTRSFDPETELIFEGNLNESGEAKVRVNLGTNSDAPGLLSANFRTRVHEPGGAFSVDRFSIPYSPYERYVGIRTPKGDKARGMLLTDTKHTVEIVAVDGDGAPAGGGQVDMKLYKISWRWWWEKGAESLARYSGSSSYSPVLTGKAKLKKGKANWQFEIKYPQWGRYLLVAHDKKSGHRTGKIIYIDWPGWAGRAQKDNPGGATVLSFSSDKQSYTVGEKVTLTVPTSETGRGLVSIESGSRVVQADWLQATGKETKYTFTATADMAPNVFAHVTLMQPHLQTKNDLPIRIYGVIPIAVVNPKTKLEPQVEAPEVFEPMSKSTVKVKEANGQAMTYTLAVVDQGLLGLTRFKTPNLWKHFYRREALGVRTWDIYDHVAGAYGATLENMLAIGGGDEGEDDGKSQKANRFPPMVRFYGPFALAAGKTASHEVDIGEYIGAVRVMVVAGHKGAYGSADKNVFVRKPLMVLGSLPRVVGPEELIDLPVTVFALEDKIKNVTVTVETEGPLAVAGNKTETLRFSAIGDKQAYFRLKAKDGQGIAKVKITAKGHGEQASSTTEIDVRMPGVRVTDVLAASLAPGKSWKEEVTVLGMPGSTEATLEVSRIPPINLGARLDYLIRYPHGCVEQTTSSVFPQLFLSSLMELDADKKSKIETNIRAGIDRLSTFQVASGGFGYWPGASKADAWGSNYAGHFMVEASKIGYPVSQAVLDDWKRYQREQARNGSNSGSRGDLNQAYRLYTLAIANAAEVGAMNRLKERKNLSTTARWTLAAAYKHAGRGEVATGLLRSADIKVESYAEMSGNFGSRLRDQAMILEALWLLEDFEQAAEIAKDMSEQLSSGKWHSTQTLSYSLIALARYAAVTPSSGVMKFAYSVAGGKSQTVSNSAPIVQVPISFGDAEELDVDVKNNASMTLFARIIQRGIPKYGEEEAAQKGMSIEVSYADMSGGEVDVDALEQGMDFVATATVKNTSTTKNYQQIALSHLFPSGWEIRNQRMDATEHATQSKFDYQDIRDDRVYTYFSLRRGESRTYQVVLHAGFTGNYYLPMVAAEPMYDATIYARTEGHWVKVVEAGEEVAGR